MTLEGGFTLQRPLPRRVAGWITTAGGLGWKGEMEMTTPLFLSFFPPLFLFSYSYMKKKSLARFFLARGSPKTLFSTASAKMACFCRRSNPQVLLLTPSPPTPHSSSPAAPV